MCKSFLANSFFGWLVQGITNITTKYTIYKITQDKWNKKDFELNGGRIIKGEMITE